ncbi:uncharacterized protein LOC135811981 [Sycon ciliatum]|uniref:uncharacterized protein LOC135811981 n=1 Tax=Sycon ciliatum TaxID=27933 RepID=UPI0031F643A4
MCRLRAIQVVSAVIFFAGLIAETSGQCIPLKRGNSSLVETHVGNPNIELPEDGIAPVVFPNGSACVPPGLARSPFLSSLLFPIYDVGTRSLVECLKYRLKFLVGWIISRVNCDSSIPANLSFTLPTTSPDTRTHAFSNTKRPSDPTEQPSTAPRRNQNSTASPPSPMSNSSGSPAGSAQLTVAEIIGIVSAGLFLVCAIFAIAYCVKVHVCRRPAMAISERDSNRRPLSGCLMVSSPHRHISMQDFRLPIQEGGNRESSV